MEDAPSGTAAIEAETVEETAGVIGATEEGTEEPGTASGATHVTDGGEIPGIAGTLGTAEIETETHAEGAVVPRSVTARVAKPNASVQMTARLVCTCLLDCKSHPERTAS